MPGRTYTYDHRGTAAGGAGLERLRSADRNRPGGSNYTRSHTPTHTATHTQLHGLPRSTAHFLLQLSKETTGEKFTGRKEVEQPAKKPIHSRKRKKKKKKNRSSNAGQEEAARVDCLLASPGAPGRGACPRKAGQRGALAGSGRGAPVPPAPAGSMNESAWK